MNTNTRNRPAKDVQVDSSKPGRASLKLRQGREQDADPTESDYPIDTGERDVRSTDRDIDSSAAGADSRPRLLLVDDHKLVARGLGHLLAAEFDVVGIAPMGREMLDAVEKLVPDVIMVNASMPPQNGMDVIDQFRKDGGTIPLVFVMMRDDVACAHLCLQTGASCLVSMQSDLDEIVTAVREALRGRTYITPIIAGQLLNPYQNTQAGSSDLLNPLTPRQMEILRLLAMGKSPKEIAHIIHISSRTVEFHKYRLMRILELNTTADLVRYAIRCGIITE